MSDHLFSDTTSVGLTQDNSDLDYYEPSLSLRASFGDGEVMRPFVEAGYSPRIHAQTVDRNGIRRDSQGCR